MKKIGIATILSLLVFVMTTQSCSLNGRDVNDSELSTIAPELLLLGLRKRVSIRVNHYQVYCGFMDAGGICNLLQEGAAIGGTVWSSNWGTGLAVQDYQLGNYYLLSADRVEILDPPADGSSFRYENIQILQITPAAPDESFDLALRVDDGMTDPNGLYYFNSFLTLQSGVFYLGDQIPIDCASAGLCTELDNNLQVNQVIRGTFTHSSPSGTYVLNSLTVVP